MSWSDLFTGLGLAAVIEGLVLALAPRRLEEALQLIASIPPETRRVIGLGVIAAGVAIVALARGA